MVRDTIKRLRHSRNTTTREKTLQMQVLFCRGAYVSRHSLSLSPPTCITSPDLMLTVMLLGPDSSFRAFLLSTNFPVFRIDRSPRLAAARCRTEDELVAATILHRDAAGYAGRKDGQQEA